MSKPNHNTKRYICQLAICWVICCNVIAQAQLKVTVLPTKIADQKAVVEMKIKNDFAAQVESARAICFLLDAQGKLVGESAKWVIGGIKHRAALEAKSEISFNFVITGNQPFTTTNLTAKVNFSRIVLEGEKLADPKIDVQIINAN